MSKKKGKAAPRKAAKKKSKVSARPRAAAAAASSGSTRQATIFIYRTGSGNKIRTSPQKIFANPGDRIEWSVVNLVDGSDVPVTISWPAAPGESLVRIYSYTGVLLVNASVFAPAAEFVWDGTVDGRPVANGGYLVVVDAGTQRYRARLFVARR